MLQLGVRKYIMNDNEKNEMKKSTSIFDNVASTNPGGSSSNTLGNNTSSGLSIFDNKKETSSLDGTNGEKSTEIGIGNDTNSSNVGVNNNINGVNNTDKLSNMDGVNNIETSSDNKIDSDSLYNPKKKRKLGIVIAVFLILVLIGGIVWYVFIGSKNIFKLAIDSSFNYLTNNIINYKTVNGTFSIDIDGSASDSASDDMFKILNKLELSGNYGIDYKNKLIDLSLKSKYDGNELVDADIYMENGNGYIYLADIYDKYVKAPIDDYDDMFSNIDKQDDYKILLNSIKIAILDALKDNYFTSTKEKVDGKQLKKTTLKLDHDNYMAIRKDVCNKLANDTDFLNSYSKVSGDTVAEIKESLKNDISDDSDFEEVSISIYTTILTMKAVRIEIEKFDNQIIVNENGDKYSFKLVDDKKTVYDGEISVNGKKDNMTYNIRINDKENNSSIKVIFNNAVKYNGKVDKKDVSNSVNIDSMTSDEVFGIYSNLLGSAGIKELYQDISNFMNSIDFSYDDDYSLDNDYSDDSYEIDDDYSNDTIFG